MIRYDKSKSGIASNILISGICKPISMVIGYIYVPVALNYLGIEKYGIWSTILTILSWISYFDIGIGNGLRNKLTESLSRKDEESRRLVSSAYAFIAVIMFGVAIFFAVAASFLDWNHFFGVKDTTENLASVVSISVAFVAVNFILSICKNVLYALQRAANVSLMELAVQVINLGAIFLVQHFFDSNLLVMTITYGSSMIFVNLLASVVIYVKNENIRPGIRYINLHAGKHLANLGMQFFVIQICALILFTTDSVMISYLYGASNVTPYSTVNKLFTAVIGIFTALLTPIWSAVTKAKVEGRFNELKKIMKNLYAVMIPFVIGIIILMINFRIISKIWLGRNLNYTTELILFGGVYCCLNIWTNTHGTIANGLGILKEQVIMAIVQATINIPLSVFFAEHRNMGSAGILLGTNISLLISCIYLPICIIKWISHEEKENEDSSCCE